MIYDNTHPSLTLAIQPTSHGFAWIAFTGPFTPYDWSVVDVPKDKNAGCLSRIEKLLQKLNPETIVLEAFEPPVGYRSRRVSRLCRAILALGMDRGIELAIYSRNDVRACFATVGAKTRHEIAEAVVRQVEQLRNRLPRRRASWGSDAKRMGLFVAASLVLTHYRLGASTLFEQLSQSL